MNLAQMTIISTTVGMNPLEEMEYTFVPHPEPSSLLPPHSIPLGRPSGGFILIFGKTNTVM